jgi:hypothetical protein
VGRYAPFALTFRGKRGGKLDPENHELGTSRDDVEQSERHFLAGRQPGELRHDELKIALDRGEVGAGLTASSAFDRGGRG